MVAVVLGASIIEKHLEDKVKTGEMSDRPFYLDRLEGRLPPTERFL